MSEHPCFVSGLQHAPASGAPLEMGGNPPALKLHPQIALATAAGPLVERRHEKNNGPPFDRHCSAKYHHTTPARTQHVQRTSFVSLGKS
jgi:hypothetical protein